MKVCFAKLCDDLILLKIVNFHKCVGNVASKITKCGQIGQAKDKGHTDTNLSCQTVAYLLNDFWMCGLPIQAKRHEHQQHSQSASFESSPSGHCLFLASLVGVQAPKLDLEKS